MHHPTLVILAAGLSTRYGGSKQLEPVGPDGEALLDYAVYDALSAGFGEVVLVVSESNEAGLVQRFRDRFGIAVPLRTVVQGKGRLASGLRPPSRVKPWGTGHAVLCLEGAVDGPFAVANADDFYGRGAYRALTAHLTSPEHAGEQCVIGYRVDATLSEHGGVSRAVLDTDEEGVLVDIEEVLGLEKSGDGAIFGRTTAGAPRALVGDERVSMNLWGLTPDLFGPLDERFGVFLRRHGDDPRAEFYLSDAIGAMVVSRELAVRVTETEERWFGMTFPKDRGSVRAGIRTLIEAGEYPPSLSAALHVPDPRVGDSE
ncbi:MAG: NTP transferase domain-containing protein [Gemmatimonadetes bacterium]|nr:NTP transferase domain-containing protein [Gemmatimonadota bacterium]